MPIIAWDCPHCKRTVPLDHYATSTCGLKLPADYATAILRDNDDRYITDEVTVTSGIGCPRSRALEHSGDAIVNPHRYNALLIGRAWDQLLEKHAPEGTAKLQVEGYIEGIHIYGEIDKVIHLDDKFIIIDHKHGNNFAQKWAAKEGVKPEHRVQTSIYAELYAQQHGDRPSHGLIFNHYSGASGDPFTPYLYDLMTVEQALAHKPYGSTYTVLDLYRQTAQLYGTDPITWEQLPLVGTTMTFGSKSYCDYCAVQKQCLEQSTGAPF